MSFDAVLRAAKDNDYNGMKTLLRAGMKATAANKIGQTGLHVAAIWGNFEVCVVLMKGGAEVNAQNQFGITPLHMASQNNHLDVAQLLLDNGADPQITAQNGMQPIDAAKSDDMRILLGAPPLEGHAAVTKNDAALLTELLQEGIDMSAQDSDGETMLHLAAKAAMGEALEPLVQAPGAPQPTANTACLDLLIEHAQGLGARSFAEAQKLHNDDGLLPIHVCAKAGSAAICAKLIRAVPAPQAAALLEARTMQKGELHNGQWGKKNAAGKIERLNSAGQTALHLAVEVLKQEKEAAEDEGEEDELMLDTSLVKVLLSAGASPNALDGDEQTPLHVAIIGGMAGVASMLCEAKADLTLSCKTFGKDNSALHQATLCRDLEMIKLLTSHGANVNAIGRDGWTPLGLAVRSGATEAAKVLLEAKASVDMPCGTSGKTPLEIATINNKKGLIEMLQAVAIS